MSVPIPEHPVSSDAALLLAFTRLEGKVDVALTQHGADIKAQGRDLEDHEERLRALEAKATVSPRTLWLAFTSAAGLAISAGPVVAKIFA